MWTIFQLFWRHCFQIWGSFTQHWNECHAKPCSWWNIYNSSTQIKFKYRDCPSCITFLMQDSSTLPINQFSKSQISLQLCIDAPCCKLYFIKPKYNGGMCMSMSILNQTVQILVTILYSLVQQKVVVVKLKFLFHSRRICSTLFSLSGCFSIYNLYIFFFFFILLKPFVIKWLSML